MFFLCTFATVALVVASHWFLASTRANYAWGDGALLELYTIHAARGEWQLGPYSRFGWHHPGPLLFYGLAPIYQLLGSHGFAMNAGAFVINAISLAAVAWVIAQWMRPPVALTFVATLALFLTRVGDITISYWNPHVVVVPLMPFVLLCAGVWAGRDAAVPMIVLLGSFLVQTHVSLAPIVGVLTSLSFVGLLLGHQSRMVIRTSGSLTWSIAAAVAVLVMAWWLPVAEELANDPGNLSKLVGFFADPFVGQSWPKAAHVWAAFICALFRMDFSIPAGTVVQPVSGPVWIVIAIGQAVALVLAGRYSIRHGDRLHAALCYLGTGASLLALWSITRIQGVIADHLVFWISVLGALNWAALFGAVASRVGAAYSENARARNHASTLAAAGLAAFIAVEAIQFRHNTRVPPEEPGRRVGILVNALVSYLEDRCIERPLVRASQEVQSEATGVIVQLYKRGVAVVVPPEMVNLFGQSLSPVAGIDAVVDVTHSSARDNGAKQRFDQFVVADGDVYVHVTVTPKAGESRGFDLCRLRRNGMLGEVHVFDGLRAMTRSDMP